MIRNSSTRRFRNCHWHVQPFSLLYRTPTISPFQNAFDFHNFNIFGKEHEKLQMISQNLKLIANHQIFNF